MIREIALPWYQPYHAADAKLHAQEADAFVKPVSAAADSVEDSTIMVGDAKREMAKLLVRFLGGHAVAVEDLYLLVHDILR